MLLNNPPTPESTIIEQSSGSTAVSLGMVSRVLYNNENTRIYVSNKVGTNRIRQLRFFGLTVYVYGFENQEKGVCLQFLLLL
jgi:cysteine synthase